MRLNVKPIINIPGGQIPFQFSMDFSDLTFGVGQPAREPVRIEGFVKNTAGMLELDLTAETTLSSVCDRCMKSFQNPKVIRYQIMLAEELQDEENDDILLLEEGGIDLGELTRSLFILEMDTKTLCSEDCKGLCPRCGANLNEGPCSCKKEVDPRLAVLAKLLDKDSDK